MNFSSHIHDICQKAGQKLNAICRKISYTDFAKRSLLVNAFLYSKFNYCQLFSIWHNQTNSNKINCLRERCICLVYNENKKSSYDLLEIDDLLEKEGSVSMHRRNIRTLAIDLFKVFKGLHPVIFAEAFPLRQQRQYNMRNYSYFAMPHSKTVNYGSESLSYIGSKLSNSIPPHTKEKNYPININECKYFIKTWKRHLC